MTTINLTDPIYHDADKAREHLESILWPDGPHCPKCGNVDRARITKLKGKSTRPGVYKCKECRKPFSVTVGTVFERSHVPLNKWVLAVHLMSASKKGMSAHQMHRMLDVDYKTAWFMEHRIREAMREINPPPLGGEGKTVEADETYFGKRNTVETFNSARGEWTWTVKDAGTQKKVFALVERGGKARSRMVEDFDATTVGELLVTTASRKSKLMTDESQLYPRAGREFASHQSVNHSKEEWKRGEAYTNTVEGYFSVFKRGMKGVYQHCSADHMQRYLDEFDFRHNHRAALGISDTDRAAAALKGIKGKRLTYRSPDEAKVA
jgi:transposase-like protein